MVHRIRRVLGRAELRVISVLAFGILAATLIYSTAQDNGKPPYNEDEYDEIFDNQINDIYDLEEWFAAQQYSLLPILPPFSDFILENQPGQQNLLSFNANNFPSDFTKGLVGIYDYSVAVYPIKIVEDPQTRALKFYNYDGNLFYTLAAAPDYDPFAYLKDRMPWLYAGKANAEAQTYWQGIFDPTRVRIKTSLIASEDVAYWLYAKEKVEASQEEEEGDGGEMTMVMQENVTTNIYFTQFKKVTDGVTEVYQP